MIKKLLEVKKSESEILDLYNGVGAGKNCSVFGVGQSSKPVLLKELNSPIIYVASNLENAFKIKNDMTNLGLKVDIIQTKTQNYMYYSSELDGSVENLYVPLSNIALKNTDVLIIMPDVLMQKFPKLEVVKENIVNLKINTCYDLDMLTSKLIELGYKKTDMVEEKGEFSVRGDILDIFTITEELPYRIQFFDDEIEEIKTFNKVTYDSISSKKSVKITPKTIFFAKNKENLIEKIKKSAKNKKLSADASVRNNHIINSICEDISLDKNGINMCWAFPFMEEELTTIFNYFNNAVVVFDDVKQSFDLLNKSSQEFEESYKSLLKAGEVLTEHKNYYFNLEDIKKDLENKPAIAFQNLINNNMFFNPKALINIKTSPIINYYGNEKLLARDIKKFKKQDYSIVMCSKNSSSAVFMQKQLKQDGIEAKIIINSDQIESNDIYILCENIISGINLPQEKILIIGVSELFKTKLKKQKSKTSKKDIFTMPKVGDFVVHEAYGIGKCVKIEKLKLSGYEKDYICIEYAGGDMLYLPTEQINLLSGFIGSNKAPKLNKLGTAEFARAKQRVKNSVKEMAVDLVSLYSERQNKKGYYYPKDNEIMWEFEKAFPYSETEDQLAAINDIKKDMEDGKVMERLICGDVGYGKTEVAIRAAFKTILEGKQVAFLAPTTILAKQHHNTCVARMKEFMARIDSLTRFKTKKEQIRTLEKLKAGELDVICGTHRLLSKDVKFKDLGLLILDEEQRFGVADKEKIKLYKKNVNVISMSATPIPRTLHMSMVGIRDISLINTPPKNRLPVQTFISEYSDAVLKDAVNRELARDGQVFIVHNRVETIYSYHSHIKKMFPNANIKVAHGQMPKNELEQTIKELYQGKVQILISTVLIENGIDLANANTLFVTNADHLGLSQLYQLRGRVGRSKKLAYAYFTYKPRKVLTSEAHKRLSALQEFTDLGSGFKIAMRDLEIRGAGNILGDRQHGHMEKVGYDMYCKLLNEAVAEIKGEKVERFKDIKLDIALNAFVPRDYIEKSDMRIRLYNDLTNIKTFEERVEVIKHIEDVYGKAPKEVLNLADAAFMKNLSIRQGIKKIVINKDKSFIEYYDTENVLTEKTAKAINKHKNICVLNLEKLPIIEFNLNGYTINKKQEILLKFLMLCI